MRAPTEQQFADLLSLGGGSMVISGGTRRLRAMARRGWVTPTPPDSDNGYRITPDGLRALAVGVERYGLPEFGKRAKTTRRVCSDCGSGRYHHEPVEVEVPA